MKRLTVRSCVIPVTSVLCLAAALRLSAQTTAPAPAGATKDESEPTLVLSPFIVEATEDSGYSAKDTLASTRVRTELKDTASAISVITQQFLKDTGVKNNQDLLIYTPNTEVAGLRGNFSGQGGSPLYVEAQINPSNTTRVRGLDSADNTRDYFLTDIPWDGFNVGRVDLQRGPNSILFGVGSPAGIINNSVNDASFKTAYNFENVVASYGSLRNSADLNQVLIPGVLAVRAAAVNDNKKYQQKEAFNNATRYYGALRFSPKLFGEGFRTELRAKIEHGSVKSNNPRSIPPVDEITPWFKSGLQSDGTTGYNKLTVNQYSTLGGRDYNSGYAQSTYNLGGWAQGRTYWADPISYFNADATAKNASSIPSYVMEGMTNNAGGPAVLGLSSYRPLGIPDYTQFAANAPGFVAGGPYYADRVLTDTSIFDFYNHMLDGENNTKQWQKWTALNVAISQTMFHDRLAMELAFDHQDYTSGQYSLLSGSNHAISIDVNETLSDGSANPNVGRPFVANSSAYTSNQDNIIRNSVRFTVTGEIRPEDFLGKNNLTKFIGRQVFTGLLNEDRKVTRHMDWSQYAASQDYARLIGRPVGTLTNERQFDWVNYIGPSLAGASSASGAHLNPILNTITPGANSPVRWFNNTYNSSLPQGGQWLDYDTNGALIGPHVLIDYDGNHGANGSNATGLTYTGGDPTKILTNAMNPANYVGWSSATIDWLSADNPSQFPELVRSASRTRYKDLSRGITWQGYFLDGDLVPTFGWRKDSVKLRQTFPNTGPGGNVPVNYSDSTAATDYSTKIGESKSWGGVYHLPKALTSKLPGGTTVSLFYNRSSNFKADAPRKNLAGTQIANPTGDTKEYGFTITTLDDKLSLKVDWYRTKVKDATFNVTNGNSIAGLGANGYWMWAGPSWGYGWAAQLQDGLLGNVPNNGTPGTYSDGQTAYWNYSAGGFTAARYNNGVAITTQAAQDAFDQTIVNAWTHLPVPNGFFTYYGMHPYTILPANGNGNLRNAISPALPGRAAFYQPGDMQPGAISAVSTVDTISKGTEFELVASPTKNWNLTLNYTRTFATSENIDPLTQTFMADMYDFMRGPGGALRMWGNGAGNEMGPNWVNNVYNPYLVQLNSIGHSAPEVSPWRVNGVTTYNFDHGALKGAFVGGGMRIEAGRIIGYKYSPTVINHDRAKTPGGLDVDQPIIGDNDKHFDLWVGYKRKIGSRVNWRIQVNVHDVGESTKLVAARMNPDNSLALAKIQQGQTWELTNSFDF